MMQSCYRKLCTVVTEICALLLPKSEHSRLPKSVHFSLPFTDTDAGSVSGTIGTSSLTHKVLLGWMAAAPMCYSDGVLYFMPMDELTVMRYPGAGLPPEAVAEIKSDTFMPEVVQSEMDNQDETAYRYANPYVLMLFKRENHFYALTSEGEYHKENNILSDDNRFCSIYRVSGNGEDKIMSFTMDSFGYGNLLSIHDGDLYFISHTTTGNDDINTLKKLLIGQ